MAAATAVISTVATPVLSQPLKLGADIVLHSATKCLNGHSDVVAGVLVARENSTRWELVLRNRNLWGAIVGTFEAWLLLRGLRTLHLRVRQANVSALAIAQTLEGHPGVADVLYPGLPRHPQHAAAKRQMAGGFGGMLSIRLSVGIEASEDLLADL